MATYGAGLGAVAIFFTSDWVGGRLMKFFPIYNKKYDKPAYNGASGNWKNLLITTSDNMQTVIQIMLLS